MEGRAGQAVAELKKSGLFEFIQNTKKPFLGICLGMQLLFDYSEEDSTEGLGIIKGTVRKFKTEDKLPVPQIGWNEVITTSDNPMMSEKDRIERKKNRK